jgi:hypothetical protein
LAILERPGHVTPCLHDAPVVDLVGLFHVAVGVHVVPVVGVDGVAGYVGWGVGGGGGVRARHPGLIGDGVQLSFQG